MNLRGEAGDGEYAYPLILKAQPDILVTDIKMPFMDGLELSRLVKKALPRTRIIVLSGYNEFEYAKEAIKIGISDYLLKPVSSAGLIDALKKAADEIREEQEKSRLLGGILSATKNIRNFWIKRITAVLTGSSSMIFKSSAQSKSAVRLSRSISQRSVNIITNRSCCVSI